MFNETSYFGDRTPECEAIKLNCDTRFPPSDDPAILAGQKPDLNWDCMKATGYVSKCMNSTSYKNPGDDFYPVDIVTNPDNPDYLLPKIPGLGSMNTPALLAIGAVAIGAILLLKR